MPRPARTSLAAVTALLLAASLSAPAVAAVDAGRRTPPVTVTATSTAFSPNGDGSKDVGTVSYKLAKPGRVTATVSKGGKKVLTRQLGRQGKGTKTFRWNGKRAGGKVAPDGTYTVTIASRGGKARTPLEVDARYSSAAVTAGELTLSSDTVYPRTTVIKDVVVGLYSDKAPFASVVPTEWQVLAKGRVVRSGKLQALQVNAGGQDRYCYCSRMTWDGKDARGKVMAVGTYTVRVLARDGAGNPVVVSSTQPVSVSTTQLVAQTTTRSFAMADAKQWNPFFNVPSSSINDSYCNGSKPSSRFPNDGLTFQSVEGDYVTSDRKCLNLAAWEAPVSGRRTPSDRFSISATGGSSTAGSTTDEGTLFVRNGTSAVMRLDQPQSVTGPFRAFSEVPVGVGPSGITWFFQVEKGRSYDLTGFTLTTTQYVPAS